MRYTNGRVYFTFTLLHKGRCRTPRNDERTRRWCRRSVQLNAWLSARWSPLRPLGRTRVCRRLAAEDLAATPLCNCSWCLSLQHSSSTMTHADTVNPLMGTLKLHNHYTLLKNSLSIVVYFISYEINYPVLAWEVFIMPFVHPHILYGIELYANTFSTYFKPLNVLYNKLSRILQNCRLQTPVAHLYQEYQTLPINQLFILQILTLVHTFFTVIMSYLKSIEIILLLIALFIAIAPDKRVICISVVFKNQ